jgi:hypothetical protein
MRYLCSESIMCEIRELLYRGTRLQLAERSL